MKTIKTMCFAMLCVGAVACGPESADQEPINNSSSSDALLGPVTECGYYECTSPLMRMQRIPDGGCTCTSLPAHLP